MIIVTLSSIPPRFPLIEPTLRSILDQTRPPEEIRLYIPKRYRRFPGWNGTLPDVPRGVTIHRCEEDLGPATKVLPAAMDLQQDDVRLLYCDDDRVYPRYWCRRLETVAKRRPDEIITAVGLGLEYFGVVPLEPRPQPQVRPQRILKGWYYRRDRLLQILQEGRIDTNSPRPDFRRYRSSGYIDLVEGQGGVMVPPKAFDARALDIPPVLWAVDDIWLSGWAAVNGYRFWADAKLRVPRTHDADHIEPLFEQVIDGANRNEANLACLKWFQTEHGIWR